MNKNLLVGSVAIIIVVMFGVSIFTDKDLGTGKLIETEKSLPLQFYEIADVPEQPPNILSIVTKATEQDTYEQNWDFYQLTKNIPTVEFDKSDVYFIGVQESGSCPYEVETIKVNDLKKELVIYLYRSGDTCNADATPRTFVVEVAKDISTTMETAQIVFHDGGNRETSIVAKIR
ncbi:hypothetical protein [Litchfieldia alkalitelluris]|uniref:hypothetical protein n=1 Tax=Litchfieldia alkalitelluris TaxID=304268 RepID=UPI0009985B94|nr:hypothetical protein [Litchfieldia alkalitelluris]